MTRTVDGPGSTLVMRNRPSWSVHHSPVTREEMVRETRRTCPYVASGCSGSAGSQSRQSSPSSAAPTRGTVSERDPWTCWVESQDTDPSSTGTRPR